MSNNTLDQTLIEIEQNLEKLDSARNQVLDVTKNGKDLTATMVALVKKMQEIHKILLLESDTFVQSFANHQENFDSSVQNLATQWEKRTSSFLEGLQTTETTINKNIHTIADTTDKKSQWLLDQQEIANKKNIKSLIELEGSVADFKKYVSEFSFEEALQPIAEDLKSHYDNSNRNITDTFTAENQQFQNVLKQTFEDIQQTQKRNSYITWGLLFCLIVLIITFNFMN